jgi:hypothetical protein
VQPLTFWAWFTLVNMKFSSFIHLPANNINFILLYDWIKFHWVSIYLSIYVSIYLYKYISHFLNPFISCGAFGLFPKIVNSTINMVVLILEYILSCICPGIVSLDHIVVLFLFLGDLHIAFCKGCTNLYSHRQCKSVYFSPHPHQHLLLFVLLMIAIGLGELKYQCFDLHFLFFILFIGHFYVHILRTDPSVHLLIYSVGCWLFQSLFFWAFCMFWLVILCQIYSWKIFSLIL